MKTPLFYRRMTVSRLRKIWSCETLPSIMTTKKLKPVNKIKVGRYRPEIHGWRTSHFMLDASDKIAVCGYNDRLNVTFIDLFSGLEPLASKEIYEPTDRIMWPRFLCFLEKAQLIATCSDRTLQLYKYEMKMPLDAAALNGEVTCMASREEHILIAFFQSRKVDVFDLKLKNIKTIFLEGMDGDWPFEITAIVDPNKIFVCTTLENKALQYNDHGFLRCKYNNLTRPELAPMSITVSKQLDQLFILWGKEHILVHSLGNNRLLYSFYVDNSHRIRINLESMLLTIGRMDGDINVYNPNSAKAARRKSKGDKTISC
ncbi:uncharacterized protein [Apostichopus japonicus]|uniref:uncharacterized protein isoform X2 n=1 Tax=Stichopus japonicus TaxID=307972 RepID=UPI003AB8EF30